MLVAPGDEITGAVTSVDSAGRISNWVRFHGSAVGYDEPEVTGVPLDGVGDGFIWSHEVLAPWFSANHSCTIDWPGFRERWIQWAGSTPTPMTHEPGAVVVNDAVAAPLAALADVDAPMPAAPLMAWTVNDWTKPPDEVVEVITALVSGVEAMAVQTSAVPCCEFVRRASDQFRPPPETVAVWAVPEGPSDDTVATISSSGDAVVSGGVDCGPWPSTTADWSITKLPCDTTELSGVTVVPTILTLMSVVLLARLASTKFWFGSATVWNQ